jgi:hypothetical protein
MVSPEADACPSCGHPLAAKKKENAKKAGGIGCGFILLLFVGLFMYMVSEGGKIREAEKANPTCVSDYTKCKDNHDVIEHHESKNNIRLSIECGSAAKHAAKYGEPNIPFMGFGRYFSGNFYVRDGKAILMEDDATFKNGFGADVHVTLRCEYDLKNEIAEVAVSPKD